MEKTCSECGERFDTSYPQQFTCGTGCSNIRKARLDKEYKKKKGKQARSKKRTAPGQSRKPISILKVQKKLPDEAMPEEAKHIKSTFGEAGTAKIDIDPNMADGSTSRLIRCSLEAYIKCLETIADRANREHAAATKLLAELDNGASITSVRKKV